MKISKTLMAVSLVCLFFSPSILRAEASSKSVTDESPIVLEEEEATTTSLTDEYPIVPAEEETSSASVKPNKYQIPAKAKTSSASVKPNRYQTPAKAEAPGANGYQIGPENNLQIDIYYGKEKISQKIQVSSKGDIICPLLGEVHAQGLTVTALQKELTDRLGKDYLVNPQVIVSVEDYSTVSIIGEVKMPGSYPIKGKLTVVELISQAQGFTAIAAPNKVKIIRTNPDGTKKEIVVRVYDIINKNATANNDVDLQGGDVVMVP